MEENRVCYYCKEKMTYGLQKEIMSRHVKVNGQHISKSVQYEQFGWVCPMQDDNCDVVFDKKDNDINSIKSKEAKEILTKLITYEINKLSKN